MPVPLYVYGWAAGFLPILSTAYDPRRAVNIGRELLSRASGIAVGESQPTAALKLKILDRLSQYGDPAVALPAEELVAVDALCRQLEDRNPTPRPATDGVGALDGTWRVRFSVTGCCYCAWFCFTVC